MRNTLEIDTLTVLTEFFNKEEFLEDDVEEMRMAPSSIIHLHCYTDAEGILSEIDVSIMNLGAYSNFATIQITTDDYGTVDYAQIIETGVIQIHTQPESNLERLTFNTLMSIADSHGYGVYQKIDKFKRYAVL